MSHSSRHGDRNTPVAALRSGWIPPPARRLVPDRDKAVRPVLRPGIDPSRRKRPLHSLCAVEDSGDEEGCHTGARSGKAICRAGKGGGDGDGRRLGTRAQHQGVHCVGGPSQGSGSGWLGISQKGKAETNLGSAGLTARATDLPSLRHGRYSRFGAAAVALCASRKSKSQPRLACVTCSRKRRP